MQITFLGTGAPLSAARCTLGLVVTAPGCAPLLIDTCGGFELARQLARAGVALADITNVIVTHRHLDHAGGVPALMLARRPIALHALRDTLDGIAQVKAGCFPEWDADNPDWGTRRDRHEVEVAPGETREIGGFDVAFFAMEHRVPTVAVRVTHGGRTLTFSADGLPTDTLLAAARGADLFICDTLYPERQGVAQAAQARRLMHPTAREAGALAARAGVKALACVHVSQFADPALVLAEATEAFQGPTTLPDDLDRVEV